MKNRKMLVPLFLCLALCNVGCTIALDGTTSFSPSSSTGLTNSSPIENSSVSLEDCYQMDFLAPVDVGTYQSNFGTSYYVSKEVAYYRASYFSEGVITLLHEECAFVQQSMMSGRFYNTMPIYGIAKIDIVFQTMDATEGPLLRYGKDSLVDQTFSLGTANEAYRSVEVSMSNMNFFCIDAHDATVNIQSISIYYTNVVSSYSTIYRSSGEEGARINPATFQGAELIPGESQVEVPTKVLYQNNTYQIEEKKTYTYYTLDYIMEHPEWSEAASYVTPEDVSAYFIAFQTYPANYVSKSEYRSAYTYFGEQTRCVSSYTRTDGYATAVPYQNYQDTGRPLYYECDIALERNYSSGNRGVGRVVVWVSGFDGKNYDDAPVAVYTDDHYATFMEYYNDGTFGQRFNAEMACTSYVWGESITY